MKIPIGGLSALAATALLALSSDAAAWQDGNSRPAQPQNARPQQARPQQARPQQARPQQGQPQQGQPQQARPQAERPQQGRPQAERPQGQRPQGEQAQRPAAGRPVSTEGTDRFQPGQDDATRAAAERQAGQRPAAERQEGQRPAAERQAGQRPAAERQEGQRPAAERQAGQRPAAERQAGERPAAQRGGDATTRRAARIADPSISLDEVMRRVWSAEQEHRERLARIERLGQIARKSGNTDRLGALQGLLVEENRRYDAAMAAGRARVGDRKFDEAIKQLRVGQGRSTTPVVRDPGRPAGERPAPERGGTQRPAGERPAGERPAGERNQGGGNR